MTDAKPDGPPVAPVTGRFRPWSPGRNSIHLLIPPLFVLLAFFLVPLATVVLQSFAGAGGTFGQYIRILSEGSALTVLLYTFQVSALVTIGTLLLGYPVAYVVSTANGKLLTLYLILILIPFWTSTVIRTYAWIVILQRRGVLNEALMSLDLIDRPLRLVSNGVGMQMAMIHIMLPFMILPLLSAMRGIDPTYVRAGAVLGANPLRQFVSIYLPLSMPGISAGCILVFISSLGFYITPSLLGGQNMMVAVLIEQQASRLLDWPFGSALATVLLAVTCVLYLIYERIIRYAGGGKFAGEAA